MSVLGALSHGGRSPDSWVKAWENWDIVLLYCISLFRNHVVWLSDYRCHGQDTSVERSHQLELTHTIPEICQKWKQTMSWWNQTARVNCMVNQTYCLHSNVIRHGWDGGLTFTRSLASWLKRACLTSMYCVNATGAVTNLKTNCHWDEAGSWFLPLRCLSALSLVARVAALLCAQTV